MQRPVTSHTLIVMPKPKPPTVPTPLLPGLPIVTPDGPLPALLRQLDQAIRQHLLPRGKLQNMAVRKDRDAPETHVEAEVFGPLAVVPVGYGRFTVANTADRIVLPVGAALPRPDALRLVYALLVEGTGSAAAYDWSIGLAGSKMALVLSNNILRVTRTETNTLTGMVAQDIAQRVLAEQRAMLPLNPLRRTWWQKQPWPAGNTRATFFSALDRLANETRDHSDAGPLRVKRSRSSSRPISTDTASGRQCRTNRSSPLG